MNHSWLYIESQGLCILSLSILFFYNLKYWKPNILNYLSGVYMLVIAMTALDICRAAIGGNPQTAWILHIVIVVYSMAMPLAGYLWFCYCVDQLPFSFWKNRNVKALCIIPAIAVCILAVLSVHTGWFYYIDEHGHSHDGNLHFLEVIDYAYIVAATILSYRAYRKAEYEREKRRYYVLARAVLIPVIMIVIEIFWPQNGLLVLSHVILAFMLILFANDQNQRILIDNLTELPNRYGFEVALRHSIEQVKISKGKSTFCLIIGDLDEFKKINDTWGHPEGDRALIMTSKFLGKVSQQYNARAYRMGGDEFAIIVNNGENDSARTICERIKQDLQQVPFRDDCVLSMSLGRVVYRGSMSSIELLNQADAKLYEEKAKRKAVINL